MSPPDRRSSGKVAFVAAVAVFLAATKGPIYRLRIEWQFAGDFIDDWAVQLAFVAIYVFAIVAAARRLGIANRLITVAFLGLPLVMMASTLWSVDRSRTSGQAAMFLLTSVAAMAIAVSMDRLTMLRALFWAQLVGVASSLLAVALGWDFSTDFFGKWVGIYFNRNSLAQPAAICILAGSFLLADLVASVVRHRRLPARSFVEAGVVIGAGIASYVVLDEVRSITPLAGLASVAAVVILAIGFTVSRGEVSRSPALLASGLVGASAIVTMLGLRSRDSIVTFLGKRSDLEGRTVIWRIMRDFMEERQAGGWGWMAVWRRPEVHATLDYYDVNEAHSGYYEVFLGAGVVGAIALAIALATAVSIGCRAVVHTSGPTKLWPIAAVTYVLVVNLTETYFGANLLPWVILVAVCVRAAIDSDDRQRRPSA